jgi:SAM-dependent methyltransferase
MKLKEKHIKEFHDFVTKPEDAPERTYSWLTPLEEMLRAHCSHPTVESIHKIRLKIEQVPLSDKQANEDAFAYLALLLNNEEERIQEETYLLFIGEERLKENKFNVKSDLAAYEKALGEPFRLCRAKLKNGSRWLDGGAGEALAMIEHLKLTAETNTTDECVAVGYEIPAGAVESVRAAEVKYERRFRYVHGAHFGKLDIGVFGTGGFDLITDLNGVLFYTETLMEDLKRYLELLRIDGVLLFTSIAATIKMPNARLQTEPAPTLARWLANFGGVDVTVHTGKGSLFYELRKTSAEILIPPIIRLKYLPQEKENNPIRKYRCDHQLPNAPTLKV